MKYAITLKIFLFIEANPTTAKTTRFVNTTPKGTTSLAPSNAPPTSLGVRGKVKFEQCFLPPFSFSTG